MADLTATEIYLRKSLKVLVEQSPVSDQASQVASAEAATLAKNVGTLGFALTPSLMTELSNLDAQELVQRSDEVVTVLRAMVGADRPYKPMYPNFPKQVMEASEAELFFNAITHYFGFVVSDLLDDPSFVVLPQYKEELRPLLDEDHGVRWIDVGTLDEFHAIFTRLAGSNGSLSEFDRDVLMWFVANHDVEPFLPDTIPQKETLALLVAAMDDPACLMRNVKTATDVLRVAVAMSEGDISLAQPTTFRNFSKRERRFLLECIDRTGSCCVEDMLRWKQRWIRLGERLHPGDYAKRFPKAFEAFDTIRNNKPVVTFNGRVEAAIAEGDAEATAQLLRQRPGDFTRRLDHVLRTHENYSLLIDSFLEVAASVSTPVLLQAWSHFRYRDFLTDRAFFPKGNAAKVQFKEGQLPKIGDGVAERVAGGIRTVLARRFSELPSLGNVFLDHQLDDQIVPFSQRSANRSLRAITRGSKFELPEGNTLRFFCWWKNIDDSDEWAGRVDIDLSVSMFRDDWSLAGEVAYYNLKANECYHSGDITSAPEGACEFIDVSLSAMLQKKIRYVVPSVLSYTGQPFVSLPECFGGWMMRQKPDSGEVFEPRTVHDKIDITATSRACVPVIIDAVERRAFWTDLELKTISQCTNAAGNSVGFSQIGRAIINMAKPTLYDLFSMHAEARGEIVNDRDRADTVFGVHDGTVTAFDTGLIMSDYLA